MTDIRFKNNGLDAIEVQDNGIGIAQDDYDTIGRIISVPSFLDTCIEAI